ncbi:ABC transporter permease [Pseudoalteromonas xiamenensis]
MRDLKPILKTIKVRLMGPALLALQIAVTFTILVNAFFMIEQKEAMISKPSGVDEANIFRVLSNQPFPKEEYEARLDETIEAIRSIPGVQAVSMLNTLPLAGFGTYDELTRTPEGRRETWTATFMGSTDAYQTLGLELVAGQGFTKQDEITVAFEAQSHPSDVLVTKALAEKLYPDNWEEALGKTIYLTMIPHQIKGILAEMNGPWGTWFAAKISVLKPVRDANEVLPLAVRAEPGEIDVVMERVKEYLLKTPRRQITYLDKFVDIKAKNYQRESAALNTLWIVLLGLTFVTALGIFGQSRFAIMKRRKQIGVRRALGASQWHVLRYFLTENAIVTSIGILFGCVFAIVLNQYTVSHFEFNLIPAGYFVFGAAFCLVLGQVGVLVPALQASRLSPAIATRTV